jgi:hypothetical protein
MDDEVNRIMPNFISVIQPFQEKGFGRKIFWQIK